MEEDEAGKLLDTVEAELAKGNFALKERGFWKLVSEAKKDPALVEKFGDRIGEIDYKAFKKQAWFTVSISTGHLLELLGTAVGVTLLYIGLTYGGILGGLSFILSAGIFSATLHPLAHYIVGRWQEINFIFYFLDGPMLIEPTLKIDYASYLKASPMGRVLMHSAGPIATSASSLTVVILGLVFNVPMWSLVIVGLLFILTASTEFLPIILIKLGISKILFADFRKTDTYRTLREWKIYKTQR